MTSGPSATLSDAERLDRLRLIRSENVGPITFHQLLRHYGDAGTVLDALPELARRGGRRRLRICPVDDATREIDAIARCDARLLVWGEADYPAPLAAIEDAPPVLSVRGKPALLRRQIVAIVGARNASANGRRLARRLARDIGTAETDADGWVVTSGLARGIDGEAHRGALESGTVAVLAGGVDVVYPRENAELHDQIAERGALISEQPPGTEPMARHFPPRNRIISGLSRGVVVVEAAPKSGSLITARLALEQGREVFAIPGSPLDPRSRGTNNLIRQGAHLTESADDVLQALGEGFSPRLGPPAPEPEPLPDATGAGEDARPKILERLGPTPIPVDELVRQCGAAPAEVAAALLELELAGRLERHPGNQVALAVE